MEIAETHTHQQPVSMFERWILPWIQLFPIIVIFIGWAFYTGVRVTTDEDKLTELGKAIGDIKADIGDIKKKLETDVSVIKDDIFKMKLDAAMRAKTP